MPLSIKEETHECGNIEFEAYEDIGFTESKIEIVENILIDESEAVLVDAAFSEFGASAVRKKEISAGTCTKHDFILNNLQINHIKNELTIVRVVNEKSSETNSAEEFKKISEGKDIVSTLTVTEGYYPDTRDSNRESNLSNVASSELKNDIVPSSLKIKQNAKDKTKQIIQEGSSEPGTNERVVEHEDEVQQATAQCMIEKYVISVILEKNALCEEKTYEKMLDTREKLFVPLRQDNLHKLQRPHKYIQSETNEKGRVKRHRTKSNQSKRFWCKLCPLKASNKCALMIHFIENHKEVVAKRKIVPIECMTSGKDPDVIWYKCLECAFITNNVHTYYAHSLRHKSEELPTLSCMHCPFQTKWRANLIKHLKLHREVWHKCTFCDFQTRQPKYIETHVRMIHKTDEVQLLSCKKCTFQTKYSISLRKHSIIHSDARKMYKCALCPFQTPYKEVLKNSHTIRHMSDIEGRIHQCEFCPYKAKRKSDLTKHKLGHKRLEEQKMYKCGICPYQTRHKCYINNHRLTHQAADEDNMHPCNLCSYQGKSVKHLDRHKQVHKGPDECKMFKCKDCPYKSKASSNLNRHILLHKSSDELTLFQCDQCEYQGKSKGRLRAHYNNVHKNPDDIKWQKCGECDFQTKHYGNLKRHMLRHGDPNEVNKFKCDTCPFRAKTKDEVKKHMVMHTNVFIKCNRCVFRTKYSSTLYHHQKQKHF